MGHHPAPAATPARRESGVSLVYVAIALSGMTALGAEVIWTRQLSLLFGATTYTFSLDSGRVPDGTWHRQLDWLASGGKLPALARARSASVSCCSAVRLHGPRMPPAHRCRIGRSIRRLAKDPVYQFDLDLLRALWVMLPAATLWGASFPLAIGAAARKGQDTARLVGGVYAANTVGAIVGRACNQSGTGRGDRQPGRAAGA